MSQQTGERTTIDGIEFECFMLDPWVANDILHELFKLVGPSIGDLVGAASAGGDAKSIKETMQDRELLGKKLDPALLSQGVSGLFMRLDANTTRSIMERLASVTTVKGGTGSGKLESTFQAVFIGKMGTMYKWAGWALQVQFKSLFGSIPAAIEWFAQRAALGA